MITGQQALRSIEQAAFTLRGQETQIDGALRSADEEVARLRADRTGLLRQLAQVRLDTLQRDQTVGALDAAERRALALIQEARGSMDAIARRAEEAAAALQAATATRHARADAVTQTLEALESLQVQVEPTVRSSPEWLSQKAAVDRQAAVVDASDKKAALAEADREAKRKPYEDDPLFMYLWRRGFGTPAYGSGFFVRFFDRKVARHIGFDGARPNYAMLIEIPSRLRAHAEACKADLDAERARLVAVEQAGLKAAGSGPLEEAHAAAQAALAAAEAELAKAEAAAKSADEARQAALVDRSNGAFEAALAVLAEADGAQSVRELARAAAKTATPADDAIVARIGDVDAAIRSAEDQVKTLRLQAAQIAQRRADLDQQRAQFRQRGYDNPMGQFGNETVIADVLGGIIKGAVQGAVLGSVLNGGYQQRPPRADSGFGGGGGFTMPSGGSWGGGSGGGGGWGGGSGGGMGGDSGGDGFTTGGSF